MNTPPGAEAAPTPDASAAPTLSRIWNGIAVQLVALVVVLGAVALGAATIQRQAFDRTTAQLQAEARMSVELETAAIEVDAASLDVMYGATSQAAAADELRRYDEATGVFYDRIAEARGVMSGPGTEAILDDIERLMGLADEGIRDSADALESGQVADALAAGEDPFAESVRAFLDPIDTLLADLSSSTVGVLADQVAEADRREQATTAVLLVAVVLALGSSWLATRRIRRQLVGPVLDLTRAAVALRESHVSEPVKLDDAPAEFEDLAETLNETATWLRLSNTKLREQAENDLLTGLHNREAFGGLLAAELAGSSHEQVAVLFLDLDDFKSVNDTMGHAAGDDLLRIVGRRLSGVAHDGQAVARLGGKEFAIVVGCRDRVQAVDTAKRVLAVFDEPVVLGSTPVDVGASIGIALARTGSGADPDELVRNAHFATSMAKGKGKNRYDVFAAAMYAEVRAEMELRRDLEEASAREQFVLHFQPVVDLSSGRLLGFEALLRWQHPSRGLLAPSEFIGLAKDTATIVALGAWVIDGACAELAARRKAQKRGETPLWMSVNVVPQQIGEHLVTTIDAALNRHGIPPTALMVEITESTALKTTSEAASVLAALRVLGVRLALDDFGTGFSSLRYLGSLPVDVIKVDRSFVGGADRTSTSVLEAVVVLGRGLGLQIIAEGVESSEDAARLGSLGDMAAQGSLYSRPLAALDAAAFQRARAELAAVLAQR